MNEGRREGRRKIDLNGKEHERGNMENNFNWREKDKACNKKYKNSKGPVDFGKLVRR